MRYVAPQRENLLTRSQWEELLEVLLWAEPDYEKVSGAIFLVAIKGLGLKSF